MMLLVGQNQRLLSIIASLHQQGFWAQAPDNEPHHSGQMEEEASVHEHDQKETSQTEVTIPYNSTAYK